MFRQIIQGRGFTGGNRPCRRPDGKSDHQRYVVGLVKAYLALPPPCPVSVGDVMSMMKATRERMGEACEWAAKARSWLEKVGKGLPGPVADRLLGELDVILVVQGTHRKKMAGRATVATFQEAMAEFAKRCGTALAEVGVKDASPPKEWRIAPGETEAAAAPASSRAASSRDVAREYTDKGQLTTSTLLRLGFLRGVVVVAKEGDDTEYTISALGSGVSLTPTMGDDDEPLKVTPNTLVDEYVLVKKTASQIIKGKDPNFSKEWGERGPEGDNTAHPRKV